MDFNITFIGGEEALNKIEEVAISLGLDYCYNEEDITIFKVDNLAILDNFKVANIKIEINNN